MTRYLMRTVAMLLLAVAVASGQEVEKPNEQLGFESATATKQRRAYMTRHARSFTGTLDSADGDAVGKVRPLEKPLLRWSNVYTDIKDGILAGWVDEVGRPMAMGQICLIPKSEDQWCIELQSLSSETFELEAEFNGPWRPRSPGIEWRPLSSVVNKPIEPAKTEVKRLVQMRLIAKRFQCDDDFEDKKNSLRLLTNPLLRYQDPKRGIVDGATFAMVHGTDPELIILIELRQGTDDAGNSTEYHFALAPMTSFELNVSVKGEKVWHKPKMTSNLDTDIFWQRQLLDSAPPKQGFFQRLFGL